MTCGQTSARIEELQPTEPTNGALQRVNSSSRRPEWLELRISAACGSAGLAGACRGLRLVFVAGGLQGRADQPSQFVTRM
jgi:hypothetical protein